MPYKNKRKMARFVHEFFLHQVSSHDKKYPGITDIAAVDYLATNPDVDPQTHEAVTKKHSLPPPVVPPPCG